MAENINELKNKRGRIKSSVTRFKTFLNSFDQNKQTIHQLSLRYEKFKDLWDQFNSIQSEIALLATSESDDEECTNFENLYFDLLADAKQKIDQHEFTKTSQSTEASVGHTSSRVKLPKIELPKFHGIYEEWYNFRDTFKSLVHNNGTISSVEKLNYLKSSLSSEAADMLKSLEITEENYTVAWDMLNERYDNERVIIQKHISSIFNLPACNRESYQNIRMILDSFNKHVRALNSLKCPTEHWDHILIYLISTKLDTTTNKAWETSLTRKQKPTFKDMTEFLSHRCQILDAVSKTNKIQISTKHEFKSSVSHITTSSSTCSYCSDQHIIYHCDKFIKLSNENKFNFIKKKGLCTNCLRYSHPVSKCKYGNCRKCDKKHNTLLHNDNFKTISQQSSNKTNTSESTSSSDITVNLSTSTFDFTIQRQEVLLATAMINIQDSAGKNHLCRAVLDSCSQSSFITEDLVKQLGLRISSSPLHIVGINDSPSHTSNVVSTTIQSRHNNYKAKIQCHILKKITENLPQVSFNSSHFKIPNNINLADPNYNVSSQIDVLVGAELFWNLLCIGRIGMGKNMPILQKTHFGWIISGKHSSNILPIQNQVCNLSINCSDLDVTLLKFWQIEEYSPQKALSLEEEACEASFKNNFQRNTEGRFIVKLPVKTETLQKIGDTFNIARKRFYSLERKLDKQPDLKLQYSNFIHEYLALGHMQATSSSATNQPVFYLPHHGVIKQNRFTTKLRVVFDGSAKSSSGVSLNDALMVGPTIQEDLVSIILRFRTHRFAVTADITKMYRQVLVDESQTSLQRILWRDKKEDQLKSYDLRTVTYGTASASYLAIRSLQQLAKEEENIYPTGAKITCRDFYVDDLLTGANTEIEASTIIKEVDCLLQTGGFLLRKWVSNNPHLVKHLQSDNNDYSIINLDKNDQINTLGLQWNVQNDAFKFSIPIFPDCARITKRNILSHISQLFDPLGLLAPIIIVGKLLMQQIWQLKLNWDESVPQDIHTIWSNFKNQLQELTSISVPRWIVKTTKPINLELHGFCDASERAYGACVYLRVSNGQNHTSSLICAKSRVAPIKAISLPRLELCGALLLARLLCKTIKAINMPLSRVYCWSDSTIILAWIHSNSRNWKTFVANRVSEIQDLTKAAEWRHVRTHQNPADMISRGTKPVELKSSLWWHGPDWLLDDSSEWPTSTTLSSEEQIPESRNITITSINIVHDDLLSRFFKFENFRKSLRVAAYCMRFKNNIQNKMGHVPLATGPLSVQELEDATTYILRKTQQEGFNIDLTHLLAHGIVHPRSKIISLNPFLDDQGIIRVGGRLRNANIGYDHKHPILLPKDHNITTMIIKDVHITHLHTGVQNTLAAVRRSYWPVNGKNAVKQVLRQCITCFKAKPIAFQHIMGDLPASRVRSARPFTNCGVDYFGPLQLRESKRRNSKKIKGYGAIFICMATKAVHLELVSDLTTETFIGAMKRFISRRGKPSNMYSDNATNFRGAQNEMTKLYEMFIEETSKSKIINAIHQQSISWHFIPPRSPHFGGLWEAAVKSSKHHIVRIVGNASLTFEEMTTIFTQIEAVLNSRPLNPLSNDPNDFSILTPGHFLIGDSLTSIPEPELLTVAINRLSRWQYIDRLKQQFWRQWHQIYLSSLQERAKWKRPFKNLAVGQMVLIREDNTPSFQWPIARVEEVHPGPDGIVRAATIRTFTGIFKRAAVKLCPLPMDS